MEKVPPKEKCTKPCIHAALIYAAEAYNAGFNRQSQGKMPDFHRILGVSAEYCHF
jgi:hypothetical protein